MGKKSPVKFTIALLLIVFLISLGYYSVFFFGDIGPVNWIIVAGIVATAVYFLFFAEERIAKGPKVPVISDKYRLHLTVFLTIIALLSILLLSRKIVKIPLQYPIEEFVYSPIIPPIIVVSAVTIFVATTYIKRYYPHAAVFASALLGVVYLTALPYISPEYSSVGSMAPASTAVFVFSIPAIPALVTVSALWKGEKMGVVYPLAYSLVLGIVAGVELPASSGVLPVYAGETLGIILLTIPLILLFGMLTVISFLIKYKSESVGKYFIPSLKVTLSLILFLITMIASLNYIFQPYYNPRGILLN